MGIQGLLPFLAVSTEEIHISEFENQYVAIDAYCWLHKGIYSCSYELAMKKPTTKYISYCMRYIEMLHHFKVKPILVFDGRNLSSKEETEKKRREERRRKYKRGLDLLRAGKTNEGRQLLGESVDVGHELVVNLMKECRKINVDCIVAPFEADAQLSYLSLNKTVACIISEDSDLLVYGCERVMFKMDKSGRGKLIQKKNLHLSLGMEEEEYKVELFRYMCILSGCDYLPSLPSIGPATALKFVKLIGDKDIYEVLPRLPIYLNKPKITVSAEYIKGFKIANNTFQHQLVYDPFLRKQVPLTPVQCEDDIIGEKLPESEAFQLAIGNIDPITMKVVDHYDPDQNTKKITLLWKVPSELKEIHSVNSSQLPSGKRQSEVVLLKNDIKRYCSSPGNKNVKVEDATSIPRKSCFDFYTNNENSRKIASRETKNFLKSRYFGVSREIIKKEDNASSRKRKDESSEEYLRRTFEEVLAENDDESNDEPFLNGNENSLKTENVPDKDLVKDNFSDSSRFIHNENPSLLEALEKSMLQEVKVSEKQFNEQIVPEKKMSEKSFWLPTSSVLDKMSLKSNQNPLKTENSEKLNRSGHQISEFLKEMEKLKEFSLNSEEKTTEDENGVDDSIPDLLEIIERDQKEQKEELGMSSPVFKVTNKSRDLSESLSLETTIDTTGSSTSLYFSPSFKSILKQESNTSSPKISNSISTKKELNVFKKAGKKTPVSRTLFQFGFKRQ